MRNTIVTLTINVDVWIGIDEPVDVKKEVRDTMAQLNNRNLEEFGGCQLLQYSVSEIEDEDNHNCHDMYNHVREVNND